MQLFLQVQVVLWLLVTTAWARDFHGGVTVDWGTLNVANGDVHIYPNSIWSIINNHASNFNGNIQVDKDAGLYISSVSPKVSLSVTLSALKWFFINNGVVSFNAIRGASSYIFRIVGNKFENSGDLFFSASGESSSHSYIKSIDWHNNGLIHIYQQMKSDSYTYLGYDGKTMVNNGQICFTNQNWKQRSSMLGSGCVTAQGKASFYFMNTKLKISEGEIFYLSGGETSIMTEGSTNDPQTFHVRGFGTYNGMANKIGLNAKLHSPVAGRAPWEYDARDGILTLHHGSYSQNFEIGTGYDVTKFEIVSDRSRGLPGVTLGAMQYNAPPPNPGMPAECKPCKAIPGIPGIDQPPPTYTMDTATIAPTEEIDEPTDEPLPTDDIDEPEQTTSTKRGLIKTVTVFATATAFATSTFTITSTVSP